MYRHSLAFTAGGFPDRLRITEAGARVTELINDLARVQAAEGETERVVQARNFQRRASTPRRRRPAC